MNAPPTQREVDDMRLVPLVRSIFYKHKRRYGARRIASELSDLGHECGVVRVAKLLKLQDLKALQPKSFKPRTTDSRHRLGYSPNLLLDAEEPDALNRLWVGDITYIRLRNKQFGYLAMLMDRYSRYIVGWSLRTDMTESLVIDALRKALRNRVVEPDLIHHTDRGGQYAGTAYREILRRSDMRQSMSRADNCYDNAFMESCFGTLKMELEMTDYEHMTEADTTIRDYIRYYNTQRKHSGLGYLTPVQFELNCHRTK